MSKKSTPKKAAAKKSKTEKLRKAVLAEVRAQAEPSPAQETKPKRMSCLDAAAEALKQTGTPMRTHDLIDKMAELGLWKSPGGQTPASTLYAAILREIRNKGATSRFVKQDRGLFAAA